MVNGRLFDKWSYEELTQNFTATQGKEQIILYFLSIFVHEVCQLIDCKSVYNSNMAFGLLRR